MTEMTDFITYGVMMNNKLIGVIAIASLSLMTSTFAANYPSNSGASYGPPPQSSASYGRPPAPAQSTAAYGPPPQSDNGFHWERKIGRDVSVTIDLPNNNRQPQYPYYPAYRHRARVQWIEMFAGQPLPQNAVVGGGEANNPQLFICRAGYKGGIHPGKVVGTSCNISWGGREIPMSRYQVLESSTPLTWTPASYGNIPSNAVAGGFENGQTLYICQAIYNAGMHPGKVVGTNCNIAWGGKEISLPNYNVLTR